MKYTRQCRALVLLVVVILCPTVVVAQAKAKPLTEAEVIDLLRNYVPPVRVAQLAHEKGIDFSLSPDDEKRLRRAGAGPALIETLRELAPKAVAPEPVIKLFTADPTSLSRSAPSTMLSWSVSDATEVTIDPDIGRVDLIGSVSASPAKTTTYTLHATRAGGGDWMKSVTVEVIPAGILINSFAVDDARIQPGQHTHLRWSVSNATSVTIDSGDHALSVASEGAWNISPEVTTTYLLLASGSGPSHSQSVTVEVINPPQQDANALLAKANQLNAARDYASAFPLYRQAAELGSSEGMNTVGFMYQNGRGVAQDYAEAVNWYKKAIDSGNGHAMNQLGWLYQNGFGVTQDYAEAMAWFRRSVDTGNATAMYNVGWLYQNGRGATRDLNEAMRWYRRAADAGNSQGMFGIGLLYQNGWGVNRDYVETMKWYRKAADVGNGESVVGIGFLYQKGWGVTRDYAKAMEYYQKAASAGVPVAMHNIGWLYQNGLGVTADYAQAMTWFRKAAEAGVGNAMFEIGALYQYGWGVATDYAEAMKWFQKAANAGNSAGMSNIGWLYQNGLGVAQDYLEAMNWYRKAADAGNGAAMSNIGWLYQNGRGVTQDYFEAMKWHRRAVDAGSDAGMNNVGWLYEHGLGVDADREAAVSWYRKAAAAGNADALKSLKRLGVDVDQSDAGTPHRIQVGGNVQAANLIRKVVPVYPPLAAQARVQGTVKFQAVIGENGAIQNLQLVSGHPMLVASAEQAVSQWLYKPTLLNGQPVEVVTTIDVNFTLSQ